jgi:hypothetical protein
MIQRARFSLPCGFAQLVGRLLSSQSSIAAALLFARSNVAAPAMASSLHQGAANATPSMQAVAAPAMAGRETDFTIDSLCTAARSKHLDRVSESLQAIETLLADAIARSRRAPTHELALCPLTPSQTARVFQALSSLPQLRVTWRAMRLLTWALCCTSDGMFVAEATAVLTALRMRRDCFHSGAAATLCDVIVRPPPPLVAAVATPPPLGSDLDRQLQRAGQLCELLMFVCVFRLHKGGSASEGSFLPPAMLADANAELARLSGWIAKHTEERQVDGGSGDVGSDRDDSRSVASLRTAFPLQTPFFLELLTSTAFPHAPLVVALQHEALRLLPGMSIPALNVLARYLATHPDVRHVGRAAVPATVAAALQRYEAILAETKVAVSVAQHDSDSSAVGGGDGGADGVDDAIDSSDGVNATGDAPRDRRRRASRLAPSFLRNSVRLLSDLASAARGSDGGDDAGGDDAQVAAARRRFERWLGDELWDCVSDFARRVPASNSSPQPSASEGSPATLTQLLPRQSHLVAMDLVGLVSVLRTVCTSREFFRAALQRRRQVVDAQPPEAATGDEASRDACDADRAYCSVVVLTTLVLMRAADEPSLFAAECGTAWHAGCLPVLRRWGVVIADATTGATITGTAMAGSGSGGDGRSEALRAGTGFGVVFASARLQRPDARSATDSSVAAATIGGDVELTPREVLAAALRVAGDVSCRRPDLQVRFVRPGPDGGVIVRCGGSHRLRPRRGGNSSRRWSD